MESLALLAAVIVLGIIVAGVVATFLVFRTPKSSTGGALAFIFNALGIAAGTWLATLNIGLGARAIGIFVAVTNATSLIRLLRNRT